MQRIRLAGQLGAGLTGVTYVLDEPTVGLHQRDTGRVIDMLKKLTKAGNTVVVVEHDPEMIRAADWVVDMGPGAGTQGGTVVCQGDVKDICACESSKTGAYLSGRLKMPQAPHKVFTADSEALVIRARRGATSSTSRVDFLWGPWWRSRAYRVRASQHLSTKRSAAL